MRKIQIMGIVIILILINGCTGNNQDIQTGVLQANDCSDPYIIVEKSQTNDQIIILDVRTPQEYNDGHILNAINIDYKSQNFTEEINKLNKNKSYLVYCRSGNRSSNAKKIMEENGFTKICNLEGGITKWQEDGGKII